VSKLGKLLESIRKNSLDVRFEEACTAAMPLGFEEKAERDPMSFSVETTPRIS